MGWLVNSLSLSCATSTANHQSNALLREDTKETITATTTTIRRKERKKKSLTLLYCSFTFRSFHISHTTHNNTHITIYNIALSMAENLKQSNKPKHIYIYIHSHRKTELWGTKSSHRVSERKTTHIFDGCTHIARKQTSPRTISEIGPKIKGKRSRKYTQRVKRRNEMPCLCVYVCFCFTYK